MLKKLLTGCMTIAMACAFSASVTAADITWTGNVTANVMQITTQANEDDAESISYTDMFASADLDMSAKFSGDVWSAEAKIEIDVAYDGGDDALNDDFNDKNFQDISIDDLYVVASKEGLAITVGEFDPFGIGKGVEYVADIDETMGAGGLGAGFGEQGLVQVSFTDVGLSLLVGMNKTGKYYQGDDTDSTGDVASQTTYGAQFEKAFGDFGLALGYYAAATSINEDDAGNVTEDGAKDGGSASEIVLAAQYTLNNMAFALNYTGYSAEDGVDDKQNTSYIELVFDMAVNDDVGFTAAYTQVADKKEPDVGDEHTIDSTYIHLSLMFKLGPVENYLTYMSKTYEDDADAKDDAETGKFSQIGYAMKVPF
jgi:hypothetical protein